METNILEEVDLVYVTDRDPGIRRLRRGRGFCYRLPCGANVNDERMKQRIASLGLPPAYRDVWICLDEKGHLQATGLDDRGRKQYRYHPGWLTISNAMKFDQLVDFGRALPRVRRRVRRHLSGQITDIKTVLAGLVTVLDEGKIRVGNQFYAAENKTYGATTLLKRHLRLQEDGIELRFTAKGGKRVRRTLHNPRLHRLLEAVADLPGRQLFVWKDRDIVRPVDSGRLNSYLAESAGIGISAKTFRTWAGSLAAFNEGIQAIERGERVTIRRMSEAAADVLHNTPAIARSSYIHPGILSLADSETALPRTAFDAPHPIRGLRADENRMLAFLERMKQK